ncbi:hypothetical protein GCM10011533_28140 [Streptosporangium jomthongense]|nr:hypothetical protein GCM10011533_28140 [Streptosporangium jomthongense]
MKHCFVFTISAIKIVRNAIDRITAKKTGITYRPGEYVRGDSARLQRTSRRFVLPKRLAIGGEHLNQTNR